VLTCPTGGAQNPYFDKGRRGWECKVRHPRQKFSVKVGTIFEDSPLGLDKWLPAIWMIANCKNGVSSWEIHRALGVTQKTAWFMLQRIRLAMQDATGGKLSGEVEVDETYIGGKARNMHAGKRKALNIRPGRSIAGKVAVMGLLQRHDHETSARVKLHVLHTLKHRAVQNIVRENVEVGSTVNADAFHSYNGLIADYAHRVIDHAEA